MKDLSTPTLIKLIFAVIAFSFIFLILYFTFKSVGYGGRWNCKLAYVLAAPLGLFMDQNAAIQNIGTITAIGVGVALTALAAAAYIGGKIDKPVAQKIAYYAKKIVTNKYVISGATTVVGGILATHAMGSMINSALSSLQKPIVRNICRNQVIEIDMRQWYSEELKKCIESLTKEIKNKTKREFVYNTFTSVNDQKRLCLAYKISDYIIKVYGETIGASVRMPFINTHYTIILKNNEPLVLTMADVISVLDMIDVKENKTYYEVIYQNSEANAEPVGEIYNKYKNSNVKSNSFSIVNKGGSIKLIGAYYDYNKNIEKPDYLIYDTDQNRNERAYLLLFKYTGLGEIYILSTKIS